MIRRVIVPLGVVVAATAGCGDTDAAGGVALPGAAPPRTMPTVPVPPSTAPPVTVATTTTTTVVSTTVVPSTTALPAPTTAPPSTEGSTTTAPPTTAQPEYEPEPVMGTLRTGVEGPRTQQLQRDLISLGYLRPGFDDGQYGPVTADAVRWFQAENGLDEDGIYGPITRQAMADALAASATTTTA